MSPKLKMITMRGIECHRCGHQWLPRRNNNDVRICPKCKSVRFDTPRPVAKKKKVA